MSTFPNWFIRGSNCRCLRHLDARLHCSVTAACQLQTPNFPGAWHSVPSFWTSQIHAGLILIQRTTPSGFSCPRNHVPEDAGWRSWSCSRHSERSRISPVPAAKAKGAVANREQCLPQFADFRISVLIGNTRLDLSYLS